MKQNLLVKSLKLEKNLLDILLKKGFLVSEILIYGEGAKITVSLVLNSNDFSFNELRINMNEVMPATMNDSPKVRMIVSCIFACRVC